MSTNARQVNAKMWAHVSSWTCTQPSGAGVSTLLNTITLIRCAYLYSILSRCRPQPTTTSTPCIGGMITVNVRITTDYYPDETTWTLSNQCGAQSSMSGGPYISESAVQPAVTNCLPAGQYMFTINDVYGDGICCGVGTGSYAVVVDGVTTLTGGQFVWSESKTFGTCAPMMEPPTCIAASQPVSCPTNGSNKVEKSVCCTGFCRNSKCVRG